LDRLHRTEGDPGVGPSCSAQEQIPNPRVRVTPTPSSPSPTPPAYWPMELSDPTDSPWSHQEPSCIIHGTGLCPYSIMQWQPVSLSPGKGGGEEEEVTEEKEDDVVIVAVVDKDDEPYKQTTRIGSTHRNPSTKGGCKGSRPRLLRGWIYSVATTTPQPPSSGDSSATPPPQDLVATSEQPPL
jgi:hypothetical protein